ncbi:MAG: bile acid:sodium symporter family protein [Fulvivirga sp.]
MLNLCLAIIMFGVALNLTKEDFTSLLRSPKSALIGILSQFLILPFITFLLIISLEPQPSIALGMMLVAACPGGNISNFMVSLAKGNVALSVSLTAFSTLAALLLTPLNFGFWASLYEPTAAMMRQVSIDGAEVLKVILLSLVLPLIFGMLLRQKKPQTAALLQKWLKPLSIIIFVAFVVIAFSNNMSIFLEFFQLIVYLVLIHNGLAFISGYGLSTLFKLSDEDRKSITIETGIQNSGLGLLIIFTFFDGLGGMAMITAWWGIWHIVSGLILSSYWSGKTSWQSA